MKHIPAYRVLRIAVAVAQALPRYWILMARERLSGQPTAQGSSDNAHSAAVDKFRRLALARESGLIKAAQREIARLRGDLRLLPSAIEQMLRHDGSVQATDAPTWPGRAACT